MVLQIFVADVTGKMWMRAQYYKLKKHIHFVEIFIAGITLRAIYVRYNTSRNKVVKIQQNIQAYKEISPDCITHFICCIL